MIHSNKKNKGFSLIEIILILGIIVGLTISAFMIYNKVQSTKNAANEARKITLIQATARSLYKSQPNYNALYTTVLTNSDFLPSDMISQKNGLIVNGFKGYTTVIAEAINGTVDTGFMISTDYIPSTECIKIISMIGANFYTVRVNSNNYVKNKNTPLDLNETVVQCTKSETNSIQFDSD